MINFSWILNNCACQILWIKKSTHFLISTYLVYKSWSIFYVAWYNLPTTILPACSTSIFLVSFIWKYFDWAFCLCYYYRKQFTFLEEKHYPLNVYLSYIPEIFASRQGILAFWNHQILILYICKWDAPAVDKFLSFDRFMFRSYFLVNFANTSLAFSTLSIANSSDFACFASSSSTVSDWLFLEILSQLLDLIR